MNAMNVIQQMPNLLNIFETLNIPKDLINICISYIAITDEAIIYYNGNWNKFHRGKVCEIGAENGWIDLLIWAQNNNISNKLNKWTCAYAAYGGQLEVLKWLRENG